MLISPVTHPVAFAAEQAATWRVSGYCIKERTAPPMQDLDARFRSAARHRLTPTTLVSSEEHLRVTRQTQTPYHRAWIQFAEKHL
jgi:hypothetical protein